MCKSIKTFKFASLLLTTCAQSLEPRLLAFTEEQRGPMRAIVLCTIRFFSRGVLSARVMAMRRIDCNGIVFAVVLAYHHCKHNPVCDCARARRIVLQQSVDH